MIVQVSILEYKKGERIQQNCCHTQIPDIEEHFVRNDVGVKLQGSQQVVDSGAAFSSVNMCILVGSEIRKMSWEKSVTLGMLLCLSLTKYGRDRLSHVARA